MSIIAAAASTTPGTNYTLVVTNGTGDGVYLAGSVVTITADAPASGQHFSAWTGATVANSTSGSTTITMTGTFTVTATYAASSAPTYTLAVVNGTGDGNYIAGAVQAIVADAAATGKVFSAWTGATVASSSSASTTITMPAAAATVTATYVDGPSYVLTVNSGSGDGTYVTGTVVTVTADPPAAQKVFDVWTGTAVADAGSPSTTIAVTGTSAVTATYVDTTGILYTLTVVSGSGSGNYLSGAVVAIVAAAAATGRVFSAWTGATVASPSSASTTITMGAAPATVTATYVDGPFFTLTVVNGAGDGSYLGGAVVTITADAPTAGQVFNGWTGATVADASAASTTLTVSTNTTVTATYTAAATFTLTVIGGAGGGNFAAASVNPIIANSPATGKVFSAWTGDTGALANPAASTTNATMPSAPVTVTATYVDGPSYVLTVTNGAGDGSYLGGTVVTITADAPPTGKVFSIWTGAAVADATKPSTTLTVTTTTTVVATYADSPPATFTLTVINGTGDGAYAAGTVTPIVADAPATGHVFSAWTGALLAETDLVYLGAFRLPASLPAPGGTSSFDYGGEGLTYRASSNSLFLRGRPYQLDNNPVQYVAEVTIPTPVISATLGDLPTATALQNFADPTHGHLFSIGTNPTTDSPVIGGLLVDGSRLLTAAYLYYDATVSQVLSHFVASTTLSSASGAAGPYQLGSLTFATSPGTHNTCGFLSAYMARVPAAWQTALGGPALAGNGWIPIISRTSRGPCAWVFDPALVGVTIPAPASPLLLYPDEHLTLGTDEAPMLAGVVFPEGSRSVLFFGRKGLGTACYGVGTDNPALNLQPVPGTDDHYCYDPAELSKGPHQYPYAYYVWAYDALDLAAVKAGTLQPWEPVPYAEWALTFPIDVPDAILQGAALDPVGHRVFTCQQYGDGSSPLVHVFSVPAPPITNPLAASTTVTMPAAAFTATATYVDGPFYTLVVNRGSGDGSYLAGAVVTIVADAPPAGQVFSAWTGSTVASSSSPSTTITISANATVTATYINNPALYTLTVTSGSGDGNYAQGTVTPVAADAPQTGKVFSVWTGNTGALTNPAAATTNATMPAAAVTVAATYTDVAVGSYYVATTGNDSHPGTFASPFRTINKGASVLVPGNTLYVRAGTYAESLVDVIPSGTTASPVHISAYPSETVLLFPSSGNWVVYLSQGQHDIQFDGININGTAIGDASVFLDDRAGLIPHHISMANADVHHREGVGQTNAAVVVGGHDNTFTNLSVHGTGGPYGFYIAGDSCLIDGCDIYNTSLAGIQIYHQGGNPTANIVRNSRIHALTSSSFFGSPDPRMWGILVYGTNNLIYNNLIYDINFPYQAGNAGIYSYLGASTKIWDNTIYHNTTDGINVGSGSTSILAQNNIVYLGTGTNFVDDGTSTGQNHNLFGVNPLVVNAGTGDFHLQSGSPARGAGIGIATINRDFYGTARPTSGACDIGAAQFV